MQTLTLAMGASSDDGLALPNPFRTFADHGIFYRRGQVSILAAASGGGKSALATHIAVHSRPKIPTLYFSADTDKMTLGTRIAAGVLGVYTDEAERLLRDENPEAMEAVANATDHIQFVWESVLSLHDIEEEVLAYAYEVGDWPHLIEVDNLINIDPEGEAGHVQKDAVLHWLQQLANITNAHVQVLHHVTGAYEDGLAPIPKSGLLDKVAKRPRLVLTLYKVMDDVMGVRVVKNSSGKMAADATFGPDLPWRPEKSYFGSKS